MIRKMENSKGQIGTYNGFRWAPIPDPQKSMHQGMLSDEDRRIRLAKKARHEQNRRNKQDENRARVARSGKR